MSALKFLTTSALVVASAVSSYTTPAAENQAPEISGRAVKSLRNLGEDFYVKVALNNTDPLAIQDNKGKSNPIMLSAIKRIRENGKPFNEGVIPHGVLLDSGSHIEFEIEVKKPGPCGFGFRVNTGKEKIADSLYRIDTEGKNEPLATALRRYQGQIKTIKVDDFKTIGIENAAQSEKSDYMTCQIDGWKIDSFERNGIQYPRLRRESAMIKGAVKGGAIHDGCESESKFKSISDVVNGDTLGSLMLKFFVFANPEAKERFYETYKDIDLDDF
jgi:hypothetical protein